MSLYLQSEQVRHYLRKVPSIISLINLSGRDGHSHYMKQTYLRVVPDTQGGAKPSLCVQ